MRLRLILSRIGVESIVVPNNSAWITPTNYTQLHQPYAPVAITSLGPGFYSAELQATVSVFNVISKMAIDENDTIILTVFEVSA
jgi:hypothetical protein